MITEITCIIVLLVLAVVAFDRCRLWLRGIVSDVTVERTDAYFRDLDRRFDAFCADAKTHLPDIKENSVAKSDEKPDNTPAPQSPDAKPFWKDLDRLTAVRDELERGEAESDVPELAGLAPLEQLRYLDNAIFEIENATNP
jgi:hypothetical protein